MGFQVYRIDNDEIVEWRAIPWDRKCVYVVEDVRGEFQYVSHTMKGIQMAILDTTFLRVSSSSLFEAKLGQLKRGRTSDFFVKAMPRDDAIRYLNATRGAFPKRVASMMNPKAFVRRPAGK